MKICDICNNTLSRNRYKLCRDCYKNNLKGQNNPFYGKKHLQQTIKKIKDSLKGKFIGKRSVKWKGGKPNCIDCGIKLSRYNAKRCKKHCNINKLNPMYGKKHIVETIFKQKEAKKGKYIGENNPNYIDGRTPLCKSIRNTLEYKDWRSKIFIRDNYICQSCNKHGGNLEVDHIILFSIILHKFLKEYDQFSPIEDKETLLRLAIKYKDFWDINNGQTLCKSCHHKKTYCIIK